MLSEAQTTPAAKLARPLLRLLGASAVSPREKLRAALWACIAIGLTTAISHYVLGGLGIALLLPSMGASAVILFAAPHSPMAKPWALIGGHLLSGAIGVACSQGIANMELAAAAAVGLSIFAMHWLGCLHPPGGASSLIPVLGGASVQALGLQFLLTPLALNVVAMLAVSQLYLRVAITRSAPPPAPVGERPQQPSPIERLGIQTQDLRAALRDLDEFVDVDERELKEIYNLATARAFRREFGELTCARIMSAAPIAVEFGEDLEAVWALMRQHKIKALPVIDRGRHVLGVITLTDFFRHARVEQHENLGEKLRKLIQPSHASHSQKPEVAGQIMSAPALTARADAHIAELARLLTERGIHQAPIVDERGKLAGLVTQTDMIAALYRVIAAGQNSEQNL
jgi:CBS domain-containing membrane protein